MKLETVRSLKMELFDRFIKPGVRFCQINGHEDLEMEVPFFDSPVAFGVAPIRQGKSRMAYALAVRLAPGVELDREVIKRLPKGTELDVARNLTYKPLVARKPMKCTPRDEGQKLVLKAGYSCGHYKITAGTLGGFVEDSKGKYILSNNHVLANCNEASVGDNILQPGPYDIKDGKYDIIGHLTRWYNLSENDRNGVDAAIAILDKKVDGIEPHEYDGIGKINPKVIEDRYEVDCAIKRGRTTKVTEGFVSAYEVDGVRVGYGGGRVITFDGLIEFLHHNPEEEAFGQPGDSGSVIFDDATKRPFALLFAGGTDHMGYDRTLANFMPDVLKEMNVKFIGG